jgi:hypothetical protein
MSEDGIDCTGTDERQANLSAWALKKLACTTPTPGVFSKRVHKILKIKDRRCKKRARVKKMLKAMEITALESQTCC